MPEPEKASERWTVRHPGLLIFLLDQSAGMADIHERVTDVVNRRIDFLACCCIQRRNIYGKPWQPTRWYRPKVKLAVLAYGDTVANVFEYQFGSDVVPIDKLTENPLRVETRTGKEIAPTGKIIECEETFPIWVEPNARGATAMSAAIEGAARIAKDWTRDHPYSHPPIVLNITNGAATDGDIRVPGLALVQDAQFYHCHLSNDLCQEQEDAVRYPVTERQLPKYSDLARLFFEISSSFPSLARRTEDWRCRVISGSEGFVFNGGIDDLDQMIDFATSPKFVREDDWE